MIQLEGIAVAPTIREGQVVERNERIVLSERDTLRVLGLLENPPKPTNALFAACSPLPEQTLKRAPFVTR